MLSARDKCLEFNLPGKIHAANMHNKNFASFAVGSKRTPNYRQGTTGRATMNALNGRGFENVDISMIHPNTREF